MNGYIERDEHERERERESCALVVRNRKAKRPYSVGRQRLGGPRKR